MHSMCLHVQSSSPKPSDHFLQPHGQEVTLESAHPKGIPAGMECGRWLTASGGCVVVSHRIEDTVPDGIYREGN